MNICIGRVHLPVVILIGWGCAIGMLFDVPSTWAQTGVRSVRAIGMGGPGTSHGPSAIFANPAHLTTREVPSFEVRLLDIRAYGGGNLFQFQHYNATLASGQKLTDAQIEHHLDSWFKGKQRSGTAYVSFVPVALSYRPRGAQWAVGAGLRVRGITEAGFDRGVLDLLLLGTGTERTIPLNGHYRAFSTVDLSGAFSYAFETVPLSVGVSPRLIFGTDYADGALTSEVKVREEFLLHTFDYTARASGTVSREVYDSFNLFRSNVLQGVKAGKTVAGIGGGLDFGATYEVSRGVSVSMSISDLGWIRWTRDAQTVTPVNNRFRYEGVEFNRERLQEEFDGRVVEYYRHQVDSLARAAYEDVERDRSAFTTALPTTLALNGTWTQGRYTVNSGASVDLKREFAGRSAPAVHAGGEARFGRVPLRMGVRLGGPQALTIAGGLGLVLSSYRFEMGVSVSPSTSFLGSGARYAVGLSFATLRF